MYYLLWNSAYKTNLIVNDDDIVVFPIKYFGKPMATTDVWWDWQTEELEYDEAKINVIAVSKSLKALKRGFRPFKKRTDYGQLTRALKRGRLRYGEEAVNILRQRREKRTYDAVCKLSRELSSINRRPRIGGTIGS